MLQLRLDRIKPLPCGERMVIPMDRIDQYLSVIPNHRQKQMQELGFYAFVHYGLNTFTSKEWSRGKDSPRKFNPRRQNTDQWAAAVKAAGAKGIILTAKHHDGFCLWPTKTTSYSIQNSPYQNGKGDIVREVSESCRKYGLKFGLYLSPWDRNSALYGAPAYDDFYCRQLTELLTNYGDVFCMWFDGACAAGRDGKPKQRYDFKRYFDLIHSIQPGCALSNCGPDIRWVGNEAGIARKSEWNVVPSALCDESYIASLSQQGVNDVRKLQKVNQRERDLGSREFLADYDDFMWYPAEVNVSIRFGWFYHWWQFPTIKSVKKLLHIYNTAVGGNSLFLLNIPPDKNGLFAKADVKRLRALGQKIQGQFASRILQTDFMTDKEAESYEKQITFPSPVQVRTVALKEDTDFSQRVERFKLTFYLGQTKVAVHSATVIGFSKFVILKNPVMCDRVVLSIQACRRNPKIKTLAFYQ